MSSRATSVRPPYITIRTSRARAPSYVPPPSSPGVSPALTIAASDVDLGGSNCSFRPEPDSKYTIMPRALLASIFSIFSTKSERHNMYSLSSSATSSVDSLSLPLPASPQQATFGTDVWQKDGHFRTGGRPTAREIRPWWSGGVSTLAPLMMIFVLFPLSTMLVIVALFSLPITASFPRTLSELSQLGLELQAYSESGLRPRAHVLGVLSLTAVWKHAWSVPGSVLLNVLSGVLMSPVSATLLMTSLTALGSVLSSLLATPLAPIVSQILPNALALTRSTLEGGDAFATSRAKSPGWVRLSVLRLIGVVPWSGINIACGVSGVSLFDCILGAFIGTLPWTAVTCQIGDILQTVASTTTSADPETLASLLHSPTVVFKLAILTLVSLIPILARDRLKSLIARVPEHEEAEPMEAAVVKVVKEQRWWLKRWQAWKGEGMTMMEMTVSSEKPPQNSTPS